MNATRAVLLMSLTLVAVGVRAQRDAMQAVARPDEHSKSHSTVVYRLSRPATTYAANCAGCHGASGRSSAEMPALVNRIGYFARIPDGRAYLAQVPGVAMSAVSDDDLAQMLNWLLKTYSAAQLPPGFKEYSGAEIAELRRTPIVSAMRRIEVVRALVAAGQIPSSSVLD